MRYLLSYRRRAALLPLLGLLWLTLPRCAWSQPPPPSPPPPPSQTLQNNVDKRLNQTVSITGEQMYLGELLEKLSAQASVSVSASDEDGAAGERVSVCLKDVPLRNVMQALWSLVSYQKAEWQWETVGADPAHCTYRLLRPRAARYLSAAIRAEVQDDFEKHANNLLQGLHATPEERAQIALRDPAAGRLLADKQLCAGLSIFDEALSAEDKALVLRGAKKIDVPLASLSPAARELVRSETAGGGSYTKAKDGSLIPDPPPTSVTLSTEQSSGSISPTLFILMGHGGHGYMGGDPLNNKWKNKLNSRWMLPGDKPDDAMENKTVALPVLPRVTLQSLQRKAFFAYLVQFAKVAPLCFLAHLPRTPQIPPARPRQTIGATFQSLVEEVAPPMQHKWCSTVLLLAPATHIVQNVEEERAPWLVVKKFRSVRDAASQGLPTVGDFVTLARDATAAQWKAMGNDIEFEPLVSAAQWHRLFLWMSRDPQREVQMISPQGIAFGALAPQMKEYAATDPQLAQWIEEHKISRVRLNVDERPGNALANPPEPPSRSFSFWFLDRKGKLLSGTGFSWEGTFPKKD